MKKRTIGFKMLSILLIVGMISMALLSTISYFNSKSIIENQIRINMNSELALQINNIMLKTEKIETMANQIAKDVAVTYQTTPLSHYEEILGRIIYDSELAYGSGIYFEPYQYDKSEKYIGPYVYKDGESPVVTYDYSNAEYDYFNQDWYTNATGGSKEATFSKLFYDETSKVTMSSCVAPIYDKGDTLIGVVSVDIDITSIQNMINQIVIGDEGRVYLVAEDGTYITNEDTSKIMTANIMEEESQSLKGFASKMLANDKGIGNYTKDEVSYQAYYDKVNGLGWKILIQIPTAEINRPLQSLLMKLIIISVVALLMLVIAIVFLVRYITKGIKKVKDFALQLAEGNFTIQEIKTKSKDELGQMVDALNIMLQNNKAVLQTLTDESRQIRDNSLELESSTVNVTQRFQMIGSAIKSINEDMMSSSAATEEVNASVEEVNASINILTQETEKSDHMAESIKDRASDVQKRSNASFEKAMLISTEKEKNLNQSMEDARVVEQIGVMAATISDIAGQVNLLSLNASIEAARAGEQGKGFAVVAEEIGKLAAQTSATVREISQTTDKVQLAFDNLMNNSRQLLTFIQEVVTPDYELFVQMGNQYEMDADHIKTTANQIADMTQNIERIIYEVVQAIQGIAAESEHTSSNSSDILLNMDQASEVVENIVTAVNNEKELSNKIDHIVNQFKL